MSERKAKRLRVAPVGEGEGPAADAPPARGWLEVCAVEPTWKRLVGGGGTDGDASGNDASVGTRLIDRMAGLGTLRHLDDLTLLRILGRLAPIDLCRVVGASKASMATAPCVSVCPCVCGGEERRSASRLRF
jgi:hypothetical protein